MPGPYFFTSATPGRSASPRTGETVNDHRGDVPDDVLDSARRAGVTDEEIAETIGHVAFNMLTNYFNKAVGHRGRLPRRHTLRVFATGSGRHGGAATGG